MFAKSVKNYYDVIICGGGMIGSVLACKLAKNPSLSNLSILLIENEPRKSWKSILNTTNSSFSNRVSSLNESTKQLLESVGIWDIIRSSRCKTVSQIKVWSSSTKNITTTFNASDVPNMDYLAYIVENNILIAAAMEQLEILNDRVNVIHDSSIEKYILPENSDTNVTLRLNDDTLYECKLLLGTDGANSKVRQAMKVPYLTFNYNQRAVVATLKVNNVNENNIAWQKFLSTGPVALLPVCKILRYHHYSLSSDYSSLVWSTIPEQSKKLSSLPKDSFIDALNAALWEESVDNELSKNITHAVSKFLYAFNIKEKHNEINPPVITDMDENSIASFPVGFGHSACYVSPRVAILGDAAHRVHPLAGQGVNLGFGDIECLNNVLTKYTECGVILGHIDSLREYETIRQRVNVPKLIGIDLIQRIVGHNLFPCIAITNTGFQITDSILSLKKCLINTAAYNF